MHLSHSVLQLKERQPTFEIICLLSSSLQMTFQIPSFFGPPGKYFESIKIPMMCCLTCTQQDQEALKVLNHCLGASSQNLVYTFFFKRPV